MNQKLVVLLSLLIGLSSYAQKRFQQGYIIKNDDLKVDVWIKNDDWAHNPNRFRYKLTEDSEVLIGNTSNIKEFYINDSHKYVRYTVDIDRSNSGNGKLSTQRTPEFNNETIFLKTLVENTTTALFGFSENSFRRFFYKTPEGKVEQLIYKEYKTEKGKVAKNELYKKQLTDKLTCPGLKWIPKYWKKSLVKYFIELNACAGQNEELINYTLDDTKSVFHFRVKAGTVFRTALSYRSITFGESNEIEESILTPRAAIELEYQFPFDNNRLGVFAEAAYYSYSGSTTFIVGSPAANPVVTNTRDIGISGFEIPLGLRYYFPLPNASKVFLNSGFILDFPSQSDGEDLESDNSAFLGIGYEFQSKLNVEVRYNLAKELEYTGTKLTSNYGAVILQVAYTIF